LKALDEDNTKLKKLPAEQMLDAAALRLYLEEGLAVRKRRARVARRKAVGTR